MINRETGPKQTTSPFFDAVPMPGGPALAGATRAAVFPPPTHAGDGRRTPTTIENWIGRIGVPIYFGVLVALAFLPDVRVTLAMPEFAVRDLRSVDGVLPWLTFATGTIALAVGRFAPLGFLTALALPRRRRWARRFLFVSGPSVVIASVLAAVVLYAEAGARTEPGQVLFAVVCCAVGAWMGVTWLRGWLARFLLLPKLVGAALAVVVAIGASLYLSLRAQPFESGVPAITSDTTRRVYRMFRDKNPKSLEPGATTTLRLSDRDVNEVIAWSTASLLGESNRVQVELAEDSPHVLISAVSPITRGDAKYLNVVVGGAVRITSGRLELDIRRLRLGSIDVPRFALAGVSPQVSAMINRNPQLRPFLDPVQSLKVNAHDVTATYGRADLPPGTIAALFEGEALEEVRAAVSAHTKHLLESEARRSAADRRFGASLEAAFRYARERSKDGDPRIENQAAILALGMLLGHSRVEQLVGTVMDGADRRAAIAFEGATLRQRDDWPKHFFVSASISVLSMRGLSDGVGIFKEELDSDGGSGFSFGDLLADRAGTTFAVVATRDDASARAIQNRLAHGYQVDDFMPVGADLPENMQQAEFKARFGGVGGTAYRRVADEIERRIASCAAYRKKQT